MEQFIWAEKYRPTTIDECILPVDIKQVFQQMVKQGDIPNLLLVGPPGPGKTTVARAMLNELNCDVLFVPASIENGIDVLRTKIANFASSVSFKGKRKFVILDEADYLAPLVQPALRNSIEQFARNCGFILTANYANKIIPAIHSRVKTVEFRFRKEDTAKLMAGFYKRVLEILDTEKVEYDKSSIATFVKDYFPDFRKILNELQAYAAGGRIDSGILVNHRVLSISQLLEFLKAKDFTNVRKWVAENLNNDPQSIFRDFYHNSKNYFTPQFIPELVLIIAKYQHMSSFVADQEINMSACLVEIMVGAGWK